jgi:hypothetical protein
MTGPAASIKRKPHCCVLALMGFTRPLLSARRASKPPATASSRVKSMLRQGLMHRSKINLYSITSLAPADSPSGTSRPSVFAVLRLMMSSIFVTCCTGRSAGFSPLRMRPV